MTTFISNNLLRTAYGLLGDGQGGEWDINGEYTRAIVELVADSLELSPTADRDEILRRIREAGERRLAASYDADVTWERTHDDLTWMAGQNIAHLSREVIDDIQYETVEQLKALHALRVRLQDLLESLCVYCQKVPRVLGYDRCHACRTWRDAEWCESNGVEVGTDAARHIAGDDRS